MAKAKRDLPVIAFKSQQAWDAWLASQPVHAQGLWLKLAKKSSGIASVSRPEAIDTALCHGWIDGQLDSLDDKYWLIRFTPRQPNSKWSEKNRDPRASACRTGAYASRRLEARSNAPKRTGVGVPPMRLKARRRFLTIFAPLWRRTKRPDCFSKRSTAPTAMRSFIGSITPKSRKPGRPGSRNSSRCWLRAKPSIRKNLDGKQAGRPRIWPCRRNERWRSLRVNPDEKNPRISLSFPPFGARTPPRPRPPHPWRLAVDDKRAAMRPLTF